ncbi:hypothetical protein GO001_17955 [Streptomyces sp. NRRL B-1677]|nr:hypothetical protein [Streptomyces sp. NRRL B-1677]
MSDMPTDTSAGAEAAPTWLSVHVHAHSDLDRHLGHLAGLLHRTAAGTGARAWFFLRYWESGPHVRLRALCPSAGQWERARSELSAAAERWARENPEHRPLTDAEYTETSAWILRRETTGAPAAPLLPSRTVRVEPFSGAWMPDAPACTEQPETLAFLTASSTVALRLHRDHDWQARARHAVDVLRALLAAPAQPVPPPAGPGTPPLTDAFAQWAERLAGTETPEVRRRSSLALAAAWPPPSRAGVAMATRCLAVLSPGSSARPLLHAWHTHCNRLGLNLLEEAAAAWTALALTAEVRG